MDYLQASNILGHHLHDNDLVRFIIATYIPQLMNFFSLPPHLQAAIEMKFCVDRVLIKNKTDTKLFGKLHSRLNEPAVCHHNGKDLKWYKCGKLHRDNDLPAIERRIGHWWFQHGQLCRYNDKPEVILFPRYGGPEERYYKKKPDNYLYSNLQCLKHYKLHRDGDKPAKVNEDNKEWCQNGKLHRDGDKPAVETTYGPQKWYQNGKLHRDNDQPAYVCTRNNTVVLMQWYKHDTLHRDGDKPASVNCDGEKKWYINGKLHRDNDLPAIVSRYEKMWCKNGKVHRDHNKPAVVFANGCEEWWTNNCFIRRHKNILIPLQYS